MPPLLLHAVSGRSNRAFSRRRRGLSTRTHLPLSILPLCLCHPPLPSPPHPSPPLTLLPSHGLCLWLNAGILSQRLPVAKRDRAPEKLGKCMWVTASQKGAFHSPLPSFLFLCSFLALRFSPSLLMSEKITDLCLSRLFSWTSH